MAIISKKRNSYNRSKNRNKRMRSRKNRNHSKYSVSKKQRGGASSTKPEKISKEFNDEIMNKLSIILGKSNKQGLNNLLTYIYSKLDLKTQNDQKYYSIYLVSLFVKYIKLTLKIFSDIENPDGTKVIDITNFINHLKSITILIQTSNCFENSIMCYLAYLLILKDNIVKNKGDEDQQENLISNKTLGFKFDEYNNLSFTIGDITNTFNKEYFTQFTMPGVAVNTEKVNNDIFPTVIIWRLSQLLPKIKLLIKEFIDKYNNLPQENVVTLKSKTKLSHEEIKNSSTNIFDIYKSWLDQWNETKRQAENKIYLYESKQFQFVINGKKSEFIRYIQGERKIRRKRSTSSISSTSSIDYKETKYFQSKVLRDDKNNCNLYIICVNCLGDIYIFLFTLKTVNRKKSGLSKKGKKLYCQTRKNTNIFDVDTHKQITKIFRLDNTKLHLFQNIFSVLPKLPNIDHFYVNKNNNTFRVSFDKNTPQKSFTVKIQFTAINNSTTAINNSTEVYEQELQMNRIIYAGKINIGQFKIEKAGKYKILEDFDKYTLDEDVKFRTISVVLAAPQEREETLKYYLGGDIYRIIDKGNYLWMQRLGVTLGNAKSRVQGMPIISAESLFGDNAGKLAEGNLIKKINGNSVIGLTVQQAAIYLNIDKPNTVKFIVEGVKITSVNYIDESSIKLTTKMGELIDNIDPEQDPKSFSDKVDFSNKIHNNQDLKLCDTSIIVLVQENNITIEISNITHLMLNYFTIEHGDHTLFFRKAPNIYYKIPTKNIKDINSFMKNMLLTDFKGYEFFIWEEKDETSDVSTEPAPSSRPLSQSNAHSYIKLPDATTSETSNSNSTTPKVSLNETATCNYTLPESFKNKCTELSIKNKDITNNNRYVSPFNLINDFKSGIQNEPGLYRILSDEPTNRPIYNYDIDAYIVDDDDDKGEGGYSGVNKLYLCQNKDGTQTSANNETYKFHDYTNNNLGNPIEVISDSPDDGNDGCLYANEEWFRDTQEKRQKALYEVKSTTASGGGSRSKKKRKRPKSNKNIRNTQKLRKKFKKTKKYNRSLQNKNTKYTKHNK